MSEATNSPSGAIQFKTLPLQAKVSIWWGFLWRSLVVGLGTAISGGIIGGIVGGIIGGIFGVALSPDSPAGSVPLHLIQIISGIIGLLWGGFCFYFYIRWILSSKFGQHRLILVRVDNKD